MKILNAGVSGNFSGDGRKRLQRDVIDHRPDFCCVMFGTNDSGRMDRYVEAEKKVARELHIPVADAYAVWKQMASEGVDTTAMLANGMNHPTPEAHHIFLDVLTKVIFDEGGDR